MPGVNAWMHRRATQCRATSVPCNVSAAACNVSAVAVQKRRGNLRRCGRPGAGRPLLSSSRALMAPSRCCQTRRSTVLAPATSAWTKTIYWVQAQSKTLILRAEFVLGDVGFFFKIQAPAAKTRCCLFAARHGGRPCSRQRHRHGPKPYTGCKPKARRSFCVLNPSLGMLGFFSKFRRPLQNEVMRCMLLYCTMALWFLRQSSPFFGRDFL